MGCKQYDMWMHKTCFEEKHEDKEDHTFEEDVKVHQLAERSVEDTLAQYKANGRVVGAGTSVGYALIAVADDLLIAKEAAGRGCMSGAGVGLGAVACLAICSLECRFRYGELMRKEISYKTYKIKCVGAGGAAAGGLCGGLAGGAAGGAAIGGPVGLAIGGVIGAIAGSYGGRHCSEKAAVYFMGESDDEYILEMMINSAKELKLLDTHDMRYVEEADVRKMWRDLSKTCHPDKLIKKPSDTQEQHDIVVARRARQFALYTHDCFVVCEWVRARDQKTLWQPYFPEIEAAQKKYHDEKDAEHQRRLGIDEEQLKAEMSNGRTR